MDIIIIHLFFYSRNLQSRAEDIKINKINFASCGRRIPTMTMKQIAIIFGLLTMSLKGQCDTLDYWHVYYNDSVIAKFNSVSRDLTIQFDHRNIKPTDTISIRHGDDTPCFDCTFVLFVKDDKKRKLRTIETKESWGKLSLSLTDLIDIGQKNGSKRYDFLYWERIGDLNGHSTLVLQMTIK